MKKLVFSLAIACVSFFSGNCLQFRCQVFSFCLPSTLCCQTKLAGHVRFCCQTNFWLSKIFREFGAKIREFCDFFGELSGKIRENWEFSPSHRQRGEFTKSTPPSKNFLRFHWRKKSKIEKIFHDFPQPRFSWELAAKPKCHCAQKISWIFINHNF